MKRVLVFFACIAIVDVWAHSLADELSVAECLVLTIMSSPEWEDQIAVSGNGQAIEPLCDQYDDLFSTAFPSNHIGCTWSPGERKVAFENFVAAIPELSTNGMYRAIGSHGGIALGYCRNFGATNVLPSAMRILAARHSVAHNAALMAFESMARPSGEVNAYAAGILTNGLVTARLRSRFLGAYSSILMKHRTDCDPQSFTNGVALVMRSASGADGAIARDKLLMDAYPEYRISSNRLAVAEAALAGRHLPGFWSVRATEQYFTPITNALLNVTQPLPDVAALRGM